jgi:predicted RNA-binding Zn ribbon-like protein
MPLAAGTLSPVASQQIGRVTLPRAVAGHPALELCNTRAGWGGQTPREYLETYEHLLVWAGALDLVPEESVRRLRQQAARNPDEAEAVLSGARTLRSDLYAALTDPDPARDVLDGLGGAIRAAGADICVDHSRAGGLRLEHDPSALTLPVHAFADAARDLVQAGLAGDVGRCPGTGCGWLFLRNGRSRRWCIMSICGNRAKARRYSERRRATRVTGAASA